MKRKFIVASLSLVALVGLVTAAFWTGLVTLWDVRVPAWAADRALVVTAEDLQPLVPGVKPGWLESSLRKSLDFNGGFDVDYNFESRRFPDQGVAMLSRASVCSSSESAEAGLRILGLAQFGIWLFDPGLKIVDHDEWIRWGDESRCQTFYRDGRPFGTWFAARKGKVFFCFQLVGAALEDPESLRALVLPRLEKLEARG